ncbi:hypothetical protein GCM10023085_17070 [Actinomadura viridis]
MSFDDLAQAIAHAPIRAVPLTAPPDLGAEFGGVLAHQTDVDLRRVFPSSGVGRGCADIMPIVSALSSSGTAALLCIERDPAACHHSQDATSTCARWEWGRRGRRKVTEGRRSHRRRPRRSATTRAGQCGDRQRSRP